MMVYDTAEMFDCDVMGMIRIVLFAVCPTNARITSRLMSAMISRVCRGVLRERRLSLTPLACSSSSLSGVSMASSSSSSIMDAYKERVNEATEEPFFEDKAQLLLIRMLDKVNANLPSYEKGLMMKKIYDLRGEEYPLQVPRGVYIWGSIGTGKTMLMDLLFENAHIKRKKRVHFHKFCLNVHKRIHLIKKHSREVKDRITSESEAIEIVANELSREATVLCFDEFQVTDIADALMLSKLFAILWEHGTVLVTTSNRPPVDLYKDGLNRQYFLPFIERLETQCIGRYTLCLICTVYHRSLDLTFHSFPFAYQFDRSSRTVTLGR